jgi:RNA-directed DNA polymerase
VIERGAVQEMKDCWPFGVALRAGVKRGLMVKAVAANITATSVGVLLYVRRWLTAPLQLPDGTLQERDRGTSQDSAVSPVLADLLMHYALDTSLEREFPTMAFERYADLFRARQ